MTEVWTYCGMRRVVWFLLVGAMREDENRTKDQSSVGGFIIAPSQLPERCTRGCLAASLIEVSTATACFPSQDGQRDNHKTTSIPGNAWRYIWTILLVDVKLSNFARLTRVERRAVKM